jgi:hypothetical protein
LYEMTGNDFIPIGVNLIGNKTRGNFEEFKKAILHSFRATYKADITCRHLVTEAVTCLS